MYLNPSEERANKYDKAGKLRKMRHEQPGSRDDKAMAVNVRSIVVLLAGVLLLMFAVHCTWVRGEGLCSVATTSVTYPSNGENALVEKDLI